MSRYSDIYLLRHGQASFGTDDYDNLSELGRHQSRWVGRYFTDHSIEFDLIVMAGQKRHRQTADEIIAVSNYNGPTETLDALSEFDFGAVLSAYLQQQQQSESQLNNKINNPQDHALLLEQAMTAWASDTILSPLTESFQQFEQRVHHGIDRLSVLVQNYQRILVVSSAGPISILAKQALSLSPNIALLLSMSINNTSWSRFAITHHGLKLKTFNEIAHLAASERGYAQTLY